MAVPTLETMDAVDPGWVHDMGDFSETDLDILMLWWRMAHNDGSHEGYIRLHSKLWGIFIFADMAPSKDADMLFLATLAEKIAEGV